MLQKISAFFYRIAGLKTFLIGLAIYLVFGAFVMPMAAKKMSEIAGKPVKVLDLQFTGYSPEQARSIIADYGDEGRKYAAFVSAVDDGLYPLAYTFLFIIITAWIYKSLSHYKTFYPHLHLLPLVIMLVDYCENACIITMFNTYPGFSDSLAQAGNVFTVTKWVLVAVLLVITLAGLTMLVAYRIRKPQ